MGEVLEEGSIVKCRAVVIHGVVLLGVRLRDLNEVDSMVELFDALGGDRDVEAVESYRFQIVRRLAGIVCVAERMNAIGDGLPQAVALRAFRERWVALVVVTGDVKPLPGAGRAHLEANLRVGAAVRAICICNGTLSHPTYLGLLGCKGEDHKKVLGRRVFSGGSVQEAAQRAELVKAAASEQVDSLAFRAQMDREARGGGTVIGILVEAAVGCAIEEVLAHCVAQV